MKFDLWNRQWTAFQLDSELAAPNGFELSGPAKAPSRYRTGLAGSAPASY